MGICLPEKALHEVWRRADARRATVATTYGDRYRVLYSGMPGGSLGPDFRDAVLQAEDGSELQGDVEIHREVSDWYAHGHNGDARYGRVVFHVVGNGIDGGIDDGAGESLSARPDARDDIPSNTVNSLGMVVPEAAIDPLLDHAVESAFEVADCRGRDVAEPESVEEWLDAAGDERFALKVRSQRIDIEKFGPDLTLQMAIFEGLGYPRNRVAFRHLAKRLPWAFLASVVAGCDATSGDGVARATALLRWAAGFGEKPDWVPVPLLAGEVPKWTAAASRPANRPEARVNAAAFIVAEWWRFGGPMRHAAAAFRGAASGARVRDAYSFAGGAIGAGRAGEIVINAVLPTIVAWAELGRDGAMYSEAMRLYRTHPALPSNSVLKEAVRVLVRRGVRLGNIRGARRQFGVMHVYKSMLLRPRAPRQIHLGCRALSS